ncbi:MAG: divalent metal cation transporter, partial [Candidatus Omnitrophota bacterium]|nr:divalent metal cation transporter [Candidatus Omnitrophota bacterium]
AAMSIFGIHPLLTVVCVCALMGFMILQGRYWTWEKIVIGFCALNLVYIPAAFMVHPSLKDILFNSVVPHLPPGGLNNELFFMLMANIGTTIAPWMVFFQQSAVVDKNMKEKDMGWGKLDTAIGSLCTVLVAAFCIIVTGTVLFGSHIESAAQASINLMGINKYVGTFLAIGLFNAGLLGAVCVSLASSWAFGEVFGWAHSLNNKVREAPWFYAFYFFLLVSAGMIVLIPGAPLVLITLFVQVVAVTLLPAALVFLILLLNDENTMGKYKNTLFQNIANVSIVAAIIILSTLYGISALFPNIFK